MLWQKNFKDFSDTIYKIYNHDKEFTLGQISSNERHLIDYLLYKE